MGRFQYPQLPAVMVAGYRLYETPAGNYYPSVTTMLSHTLPEATAVALQAWRDALGARATEATRAAADHGTAVHLLIERYLKGLPLVEASERVAASALAAFNALKLKLNNIQELWGIEVPLYSDALRLAGRTDCVGVYAGRPCIIDFKTSAKLKGSDKINDYRLQLTAYAIMHNELFGTDIQHGVILMTSAGGFPQEFNVRLAEHVEELLARTEQFYQQLEAQLTAGHQPQQP
jgi:genome maintenance exonuclease 1